MRIIKFYIISQIASYTASLKCIMLKFKSLNFLTKSSTKDKLYKGSEASSIASQMFILDVLVNDILEKFKSAK